MGPKYPRTDAIPMRLCLRFPPDSTKGSGERKSSKTAPADSTGKKSYNQQTLVAQFRRQDDDGERLLTQQLLLEACKSLRSLSLPDTRQLCAQMATSLHNQAHQPKQAAAPRFSGERLHIQLRANAITDAV